MASPLQAWRALAPLTRRLVGLAAIVSIGLNVLLPKLPWQPQQITALDYSETWLRGIAHQDSWKPMRMALSVLDAPGDALLYQEVFFERGVKLQYPPTSLLPLDALRRGSHEWISNGVLNGISWLAVLSTVVLSATALALGVRRYLGPAGAPTRVDRVVQAALVVLAGLAFYPLVRGYYLGQVQTWIDALVAGLLVAWLLERRAVAGVLAGLACLIKPPLALLFVWAALRGQWRFAAGWGAAVVLAGLLSLAAYGLATHLDYLDVLAFIGRHGEGFHPNQSMNGFVNRLLGNGNNLEWAGSLFAPFDPRVYAATLLSSAAILGAALVWRGHTQSRKCQAALDLDLCALLVAATIASPVAWTHHYGALLPVFAIALPATSTGAGLRPRHLWLLALAYALVANNYRVLNRLADTPWNFLQSYVYAGGLLLLFVLLRARSVLARGGSG